MLYFHRCAHYLKGTSTMLRKAMSAALVSLGLATGAAFADTLIVEGIQKDVSQQPGRGLTKAAVTSEWGDMPAARAAMAQMIEAATAE